jgi:ketosteroid isomerase-like protein
LLDPEIEIDMSRRMFDPEIYRGIDEVRRFRDELAASWGSYEVVPEEVLDAGDKLVAMVIVRAQGALSEAPVEVRVAHVLTFRHGKLLRLEYFGDREEALRAVGIEE